MQSIRLRSPLSSALRIVSGMGVSLTPLRCSKSKRASSQSIIADLGGNVLDCVAKGTKALGIVGAFLAIEGRFALLDVELHSPAVKT